MGFNSCRKRPSVCTRISDKASKRRGRETAGQKLRMKGLSYR